MIPAASSRKKSGAMDTLDLLKLLLLLAMLGYSLYGVIRYQSRRRASKRILKSLVQIDTPPREATAEELALIQPFLTRPGKRQRPLKLANSKVYRLRGEYLRHGLTANGGGEQMHDTLGGVEVILPYDASDFLQGNNDAEVMLADKVAIVIRLNGEFDLAGGRERSAVRQEQAQQWASGEIGEMSDIDAPSEGLSPDEENIVRVDVLGQRHETPAEMTARQSPGLGFGPASLLVLSAVSAGVATFTDDIVRLGCTAGAGVLLLCALWLIWRPRRWAMPKRVNHVRGALTAVQLNHPNNSAAVSQHWFLGDKLHLILPKHWLPHLVIPATGRVDAELRVDDYSVVSLGKHFSIDAETRAYSRLYWGRHVVLTITALLLLVGVAMVSGGGLRGDVLQTKAWLLGAQMRTYDSAGALREARPAAGTMVALKGEARCSLTTARQGMPVVQCSTLRWGGGTPQTPRLHEDEQAFALYSGKFLRTRSNPMLDRMVQQQMHRNAQDNPLAYLNQLQGRDQRQLFDVIGVPKAIAEVDAYCARLNAKGQTGCTALRNAMVENLLSDKEYTNWKALAQAAEQRELNTGKTTIVISAQGLSKVRRLAQRVAAPQVEGIVAAAADATLRSQRGGVVLDVRAGPHARLPAVPTFDDADSSAEKSPEGRLDALQRYHQYAWLAGPDGVAPFAVEALIVGVSQDASGTPVYTLDARRGASDLAPAMLRAAWWLLAWLLLIVHGGLAIVMFVRARLCAARIDAYVAECAEAATRDRNFS